MSNDGGMHTTTSSLYYLSRSALQSSGRRRHGETSINLFTLSLLSKWLWLSVINLKALNSLKLFNRHPQDLATLHSEVKMSRRSSIHSVGRGVQFSIRHLEETLTICNVLHWTMQPSATWISALRWWIRFPRRLQNITAGYCRRASYRSWFPLVTRHPALP